MTALEIKLLRVHLGLSHEQFAKALAVTANAVYQWESGRRSPRGPALRLMAWLANEKPSQDGKPARASQSATS